MANALAVVSSRSGLCLLLHLLFHCQRISVNAEKFTLLLRKAKGYTTSDLIFFLYSNATVSTTVFQQVPFYPQIALVLLRTDEIMNQNAGGKSWAIMSPSDSKPAIYWRVQELVINPPPFQRYIKEPAIVWIWNISPEVWGSSGYIAKCSKKP